MTKPTPLLSTMSALAMVVVLTWPALVHAAPARPSGAGPDGTAMVHGDPWSSDTVPGRGPGPAPSVSGSLTGATCSSVFVGSDGMPVALCTAYLGLNPPTPIAPAVMLFDPTSGAPLAQIQLAKGALLGGVYGYLDDRDRVVVADGNGRLLAVAHERARATGGWSMRVEVLADLSDVVPQGDSLTGLAPSGDGRVWFATSGGVVGTVRPGEDASVRVVALPAGERISNGLTVRDGGASVLTTRALYEVDLGADGVPVIRWRHGYAVGPGRKPGLLAHGSGTTPTYFGDGAVRASGGSGGLIAITDDAPTPELIVLRRSDGAEVCRMPAFATTLDASSVAPDGVVIDGPAATENSILALGNSVVLVNTYGFQYPPFAVDGPAIPAEAPYNGGMTRVDVAADGSCRRAWTNTARSATLPKLTRGDELIHTLSYGPVRPIAPEVAALFGSLAGAAERGWAQKFGPVFYTATDVGSGREVTRTFVGHAPLDEPMELTGTIASGPGGSAGVMWQPTMTRMLRIAPR